LPRKNIQFETLLIINNTPGDLAHVDDFHPNVEILLLPPDTASILQPMEQGVTADFKANYLRSTFGVWISADSVVYTY
jgi:hypothetical protein